MKLEVTIVGGGMIVHDQILPSLYHLQRLGHVADIAVCATQTRRLRELANPRFEEAFPNQSFKAYPSLDDPEDCRDPKLWRQVIAAMRPQNLVVIATPDELHNDMVQFALEHDQHVLCVKPLVHRYEQAAALRQLAWDRGLFVGVEYHKRFDRRNLEARAAYRTRRFGEFRCGEAKLIEPWYYRHSNFQNWFTKEKTDPFTYIGCHYTDLVYFITGLKPVEVSLRGVEGKFPNGNVAYMWAAGCVVFENGSILTVINGLGYPDAGAGANDQGMCLFCEGDDCGAVIKHDDQFRGVSHGFVDNQRSASSFRYINPDYFRLVPYEGDGLKPVGYGYESIEANVLAAQRLVTETRGLNSKARLSNCQALIAEIDRRGIIATPANSWINELVVQAARLSISRRGARVGIHYGDSPGVAPA